MPAVLPIIAVLSGCAALVFETLWFRVAGIAFGNGIWASSLVLASFMAGLAAGNALAARAADRLRRPLRFYAWIEVAIAVTAAGLVVLMPLLTPLLADLFAVLRDRPWLLNGVRLPLAFALMMLPATAMGATLPVLVRAASAADVRFGRVLGRIYGWNTLGAVAGALLGEVILFERLGLRGSGFAAAGLNGLAALVALAVSREVEAGRHAGDPTPQARLTRTALRLLMGAFVSGAVFLALEVVWFRFLSLFVYGTSLVFAMMLAVVLVGIALGGLAASRWLGSPGRAAPLLPALALASAVATLGTYALFEGLFALMLEPNVGAAANGPLDLAFLAVPLMGPVAFLSGVLFTALGDAARDELAGAARTTGYLTLANTLGAALGSLAAGFVLLPTLGVEHGLLLGAGAYVALALVVWLPVPAERIRPRRTAAIALSAACLAGVVIFPSGVLRERYLIHPTRAFQEEGSRVVAAWEGRLQTLVYVRTDRFERPLYTRLFTDGFSMASNNYYGRRYMKAFAYLPIALHPEPRRALLISYGVGSTASALTASPELERIDVVDISPDVLEGSRIVYPDPSEDPLRDPRVRVHVEDGRFFLQTSRERFDVITAEPPPPKYVGVVNLYTREYFQLIYDRLADGGMTSYWLPVHDLNESDTRSILRAFCDVFPDCTLWSGAGFDWIMAGTRGTRRAVSDAHFTRLWDDPDSARELETLGFETPALFGATFMAGPERLEPLLTGALPLVDDFPQRLSSAPARPPQGQRSPFFTAMLDAVAAREAFLRSAWIETYWPAGLREPTLAAYRWQRVANDRLLVGASALTSEDVYAVLTQTSYRTLPLWMLGSHVEEQRFARALSPARAGGRAAQRVLGIGALADRDYAAAVTHFRRARGRAVRAPRLMQLEIFALCMDGRAAEAAPLARQLVRGHRGVAADDATWRWLEATFGLPDPRTAGR